ncbi:MAG: hypothetical protein ACRDI2_19750 [Chloroflexota bacterium]
MTYELWDMKSRNALGGFATEAEALAVVREMIEDHGRGAVESWLLGATNSRGRSKPIAQGRELAERALAAAPEERVAATA